MDYASWQPITKLMLANVDTEFGRLPDKKYMERFENEHFADKKSKTNTADAVIGVTFMLIGLLILGLSYWLIGQNMSWLVMMVCIVFVLYTGQQIIMIVTVKKSLKPNAYKVYLASAITFMLTFATVGGFLAYKTFMPPVSEMPAPPPDVGTPTYPPPL